MGGHQFSVLATVTIAWGVIYGYVALYTFTLHTDRPGGRELRPFAIASTGMMIYAFGTAMFDDAPTTAAVVTASQVVLLGGWIAAAGFMHFAHALTQRPNGPWVFGCYAFAAFATVINLSGLMLDPTLPATPHPMLLQGIKAPLIPAATPAYTLVVAPTLIAIGGAAWLMRAKTEDRTERVWLSLAAVLLSIAAIHDAAIGYLPVRSVFLVEHCYLFCALAMTHHLLGRVARTDDELARRTQQLQESVADLQRTEAELAHKEQLAAVGELSAIIAQEVRHPIAKMRNALSLLREPDAATSLRDTLLHVVDQQSDRLNHLVGDLLSYAKPLHAQTSHVPVAAVVERALSTIPAGLRQTLAIETRVAAEPATLECDPDLIHQALRNLIDSALSGLRNGGTLTVETHACEHRGAPALRFSITDDGANHPGASSDRTSDPEINRRPAGTGLGLAIVDRVVRAHQGHVEIRSTSDLGTTIALTLPLEVSSSAPTLESQTRALRSSTSPSTTHT